MAIYVYTTATGALYSWSPNDTDPVADDVTLTTMGLTAVKGLPPLDPSHAWDAPTKTVVSVTPKPAPKPIATGDWIMRFTGPEYQAITTSADAMVMQFLFALNHTTQIDLSTPMFTNGVAYLASLNLLTQARVPVILAGA